jgi:uncharacterized protein (UPF0332 family)
MKPEVAELLDKARRSIKTAGKILKDKEVDFAGSRAYYQCSMLQRPCCWNEGLPFPVIQRLSPTLEKNSLKRSSSTQNFTTTSSNHRIGAILAITQLGSHLTEGEVLEMLSWAKEFLKAAENYLAQL